MKKKVLMFLLLTVCSAVYSYSFISDIFPAAEKYIGVPYILGGDSPSGFDCSGFVFYLYRPFIVNIPRTVEDLYTFTSSVEYSAITPGDILFFATGDDPEEPTHVALYIGGGRAIHAISRGKDTGVNITDIDKGYWKNHYLCAGRIPGNTDSQGEIDSEDTDSSQEIEADIVPEEPDQISPADQTAEDTFTDWKNIDDQSFEEWLKDH